MLLPHGMCTPADADYMGAVRTEKQASPWVSALLQVRRDSLADHRTVRLVADDVVPADSGEKVALRFLAPARASISSFKQGISA